MKKWMMIVNPASASASIEEKWKEYHQMLIEGGLEVDAVVTEAAGHAIEIANKAAAEGYRRFIAVGGDGTIHEVMSGLLRFSDARGIDMGEFTLGVLPYGTGNDWIRSSRIPKDISAAANSILKGNTAKEDIVRLTLSNGVFCMANIGGIGLDADICYYTNHLKRRGHKGGILYKLVAPYSVFSKKRRQVLVECDGELVYKGRLFSAVIGNGVYRGGGLRQNADGGNWNDGKLELSIMGDVSAFKAVQLMLHVFSGDFAVQPGIISRQFRRLTVTPLGKPDRVESDGEIPGVLPLTVEYTGQQINITVP